MGDFQRIQFDMNGEEVTETHPSRQEQPFIRAATALDVNEYNRQARAALDFRRDDRVLHLSHEHDAKVAQYTELEDRVAAIQRGGQNPHPDLFAQLEHMRHDLLIMREELQAYVDSTGTPGGLDE